MCGVDECSKGKDYLSIVMISTHTQTINNALSAHRSTNIMDNGITRISGCYVKPHGMGLTIFEHSAVTKLAKNTSFDHAWFVISNGKLTNRFVSTTYRISSRFDWNSSWTKKQLSSEWNVSAWCSVTCSQYINARPVNWNAVSTEWEGCI